MIALTVAVTEFGIDLAQGHSLGASVGFAAANSIESLVGAGLLMRADAPPLDLSRRRDLRRFVVYAALAGPFIGGLIGGWTISRTATGGLWETVLPFWAGDAMGVLTVGATILTWRQVAQSSRHVLVSLFGMMLITGMSFWPTVPIAYVAMIPLVWLAFNVSVAALCAGGLGMTFAANVLTSWGRGPWAALSDQPNVEVATLQLFLALATLSAWLLAVEVREREVVSRQYQMERTSAIALQRELLPKIPNELHGVQVGALYRPGDVHQEVGGDWYDVFSPAAGKVALVVGDIVGHDLTAAAVMGRTYSAVRLLAEQTQDSPGTVLELLDDACAVLPEASYSTIGYAEFSPANMMLAYACAGHPPPLVVDHTGASFLVDGRSAPIAVPTGPRSSGRLVLTGPTRLIWYTDGLIEQRGVRLEQALERLRATVAGLDPSHSPGQWCEQILAKMIAGSALEDDIVILCAELGG